MFQLVIPDGIAVDWVRIDL